MLVMMTEQGKMPREHPRSVSTEAYHRPSFLVGVALLPARFWKIPSEIPAKTK